MTTDTLPSETEAQRRARLAGVSGSAAALIGGADGLNNAELREYFGALKHNHLLRLFGHSHGRLKEAARRFIQSPTRRQNVGFSDRSLRRKIHYEQPRNIPAEEL